MTFRSYGVSGQIFDLTSLNKNIQLMLEFLKAPILVLHFSYYTLMNFLMKNIVILLSMLMILPSIQSMIRHLIRGNNFNWFLHLNLTYKALWTGVRSGLLISILGKLNWFYLIGLIPVLLMWKWMGLFLRKNHLLRCWGWPSLLNWTGALTFLLRLLCISINLPNVHAWNTVVTSGLVHLVTSIQYCWSFTWCFSWTLGSSLKCGRLKSFLLVLFWWIFFRTGSTGSTSFFSREVYLSFW